MSFDLLDPTRPPAGRSELLRNRQLPTSIGNHSVAAQHYQPSAELVDAINVALSVGAPLLLTGEPGTGKTQVAHYTAWYFGLTERLFPLYVRSTTTAEDLLYRFDTVAYLHATYERGSADTPIDKIRFREMGPLWLAYEGGSPAIVLIDEIDKAPRDFPNDLLNVLDTHSFSVKETGEKPGRGDNPPPFVVITSNSERRLPEPFLRRCIFHNIVLTEELICRAVAARVGDFTRLRDDVREEAIQRFLDLRSRDLRKKPATAELLTWLAVLSAKGNVSKEQLDVSLGKLPAISVLIKDSDDLLSLGA